MTRHFVSALLGVALCAEPAAAHKVHVFAYAEGTTLHGEVYARGGTPVHGAKVELLGPGGEKLGETTTDDDGAFTFEARYRSDHRLVVDAGRGHGAEYTVRADELPEGLPARGGAAPSTTGPDTVLDSGGSAPDEAGSRGGDESIRHKLDTVNRQVVQLRRELSEYQDEMRFRDVLGAIGYIVGLVGLAYYFLGVRKRERALGAGKLTTEDTEVHGEK